MRRIDADALKEEINFTSFWDQNDYYLMRNKIDNAPTVEQPTGEWIPVKERLPEEDEDVLATYIGQMNQSCIEMLCFQNRKFWSELGDCEITNVAAWMPLPEPYKQGGEINE